PLSLDRQPTGRFLLHPQLGTPLVLDEQVVEVVRTVAASGVDAVEPPGESAGKVVYLETLVVRDAERVADPADRHVASHPRVGREALPGNLEAMVAEAHASRADFLGLHP